MKGRVLDEKGTYLFTLFFQGEKAPNNYTPHKHSKQKTQITSTKQKMENAPPEDPDEIDDPQTDQTPQKTPYTTPEAMRPDRFLNLTLENEKQNNFAKQLRTVSRENLTRERFQEEITETIQVGHFADYLVQKNRDLSGDYGRF